MAYIAKDRRAHDVEQSHYVLHSCKFVCYIVSCVNAAVRLEYTHACWHTHDCGVVQLLLRRKDMP